MKTTHVNICSVTSIGGRSSPAASAGLTVSSFTDGTVIERSHDILLPAADGQHDAGDLSVQAPAPGRRTSKPITSALSNRGPEASAAHARAVSQHLRHRSPDNLLVQGVVLLALTLQISAAFFTDSPGPVAGAAFRAPRVLPRARLS